MYFVCFQWRLSRLDPGGTDGRPIPRGRPPSLRAPCILREQRGHARPRSPAARRQRADARRGIAPDERQRCSSGQRRRPASRVPSSRAGSGQRPLCIAAPARRARRAPTPRSHKALGTRAPCAETPMDAIPASDEHIPTRRRAQRVGPLPEAALKTNRLAAPVSAEPSTEATPTRPHVTAQAKAGVRARDT